MDRVCEECSTSNPVIMFTMAELIFVNSQVPFRINDKPLSILNWIFPEDITRAEIFLVCGSQSVLNFNQYTAN